MEIVDNSHSASLTFALARPAELADSAGFGNNVARLWRQAYKADETFAFVIFQKCGRLLQEERAFHDRHRDGVHSMLVYAKSVY